MRDKFFFKEWSQRLLCAEQVFRKRKISEWCESRTYYYIQMYILEYVAGLEEEIRPIRIMVMLQGHNLPHPSYPDSALLYSAFFNLHFVVEIGKYMIYIRII